MIRIISGIYKGRYLSIPDSKTTRPTTDKVRQAVFSIINKYIENSVFLDLFSGSGAIGIEAISRGANRVFFNEKDFKVANVIKNNLNSLDIDPSLYDLCIKDYRLFLKKYKNISFDIVFLDPPYHFKVNQDIIKLLDKNDMLTEAAIIISEQNEKNKNVDGFLLKEYKYGETFIGIYSKSKLKEDI